MGSALDPNADITLLVNIYQSLHASEDDQLSGVESQILATVHTGGRSSTFTKEAADWFGFSSLPPR